MDSADEDSSVMSLVDALLSEQDFEEQGCISFHMTFDILTFH